jgi:hypothetical protein
MDHYAKGISYAVLGNISKAEEKLALLLEDIPNVPSDRVLHNNTCSSMLQVAVAMLRGEIDYRKGKYAHSSITSIDIVIY